MLKRAITKYGKEVFVYEILHDGIFPEFLDTLEVEAIEKFNTLAPQGYNLNGGGNTNKNLSEETRANMSKAQRAEPHGTKANLVQRKLNVKSLKQKRVKTGSPFRRTPP